MLYQLSYTPKKQILSFIELPYEHRDTVLETGMLPLHHTPKERHIKFLLSSICNIGTRLWRPLLYQLSYTPKQQILSFIELPYEHRDTALETAALPTELHPYILNKYFSILQ